MASFSGTTSGETSTLRLARGQEWCPCSSTSYSTPILSKLVREKRCQKRKLGKWTITMQQVRATAFASGAAGVSNKPSNASEVFNEVISRAVLLSRLMLHEIGRQCGVIVCDLSAVV